MEVDTRCNADDPLSFLLKKEIIHLGAPASGKSWGAASISQALKVGQSNDWIITHCFVHRPPQTLHIESEGSPIACISVFVIYSLSLKCFQSSNILYWLKDRFCVNRTIREEAELIGRQIDSRGKFCYLPKLKCWPSCYQHEGGKEICLWNLSTQLCSWD